MTKKKRVLHILRTYSLHGGEKQLSKVLKPNKYIDNIFLDLFLDKKVKKFFNKKKISYYSLNNFYIRPLNFYLEILISIFLILKNSLRIINILKSNKIDIVLCHGIQSAIIIQLVLIFYKKNINFYYMHRIVKKKRFFDFFSKIIYKKFANILCNSKAVKKSLYNYCDKKKIKVVNNAVELEPNIIFKKKNNIILSIARFEKRKNLLFLIKAFEKFIKSENNYKLFLLGDGPEKKNLVSYVREKKVKGVTFLGYKSNIKYYLQKCKIFVHTALFEGMSNSVLEAMSHGIPSVVLNSPGVAEIHLHNKTGFVSPNNSKKFSNYLKILSKDIKLQKFFFKNSRLRIQNKFSVDQTLKRYNFYLKKK